jgi:hypothetical protein
MEALVVYSHQKQNRLVSRSWHNAYLYVKWIVKNPEYIDWIVSGSEVIVTRDYLSFKYRAIDLMERGVKVHLRIDSRERIEILDGFKWNDLHLSTTYDVDNVFESHSNSDYCVELRGTVDCDGVNLKGSHITIVDSEIKCPRIQISSLDSGLVLLDGVSIETQSWEMNAEEISISDSNIIAKYIKWTSESVQVHDCELHVDVLEIVGCAEFSVGENCDIVVGLLIAENFPGFSIE